MSRIGTFGGLTPAPRTTSMRKTRSVSVRLGIVATAVLWTLWLLIPYAIDLKHYIALAFTSVLVAFCIVTEIWKS